MGIQYHRSINHDLSYAIGAVYGYRQKLDIYNEQSLSNGNATTDKKQKPQKQSLPQYFGIGTSLKYKKWECALDYTFQQYSSLSSVDSRIRFQDVSKCNIGICYFPNGFPSDNFWKRGGGGGGGGGFKGKINVGVFYDRMRLKKGVLDRDIMGATITLTLYEIFFRRKVE